jgi:hypothetical protein
MLIVRRRRKGGSRRLGWIVVVVGGGAIKVQTIRSGAPDELRGPEVPKSTTQVHISSTYERIDKESRWSLDRLGYFGHPHVRRRE